MHTTPAADRTEPVIDVQAIAPYQRHQVIIEAVQGLAPRDSFMLVNDHDPRPLHLQLRTLFGNAFSWEYLEQGPEVWRVRIVKAAQAAPVEDRSGSCCGGMCGG